jgi:hypothetical protein
VLLALGLGALSGGGGPDSTEDPTKGALAPVTVAAPSPAPAPALAAECTKVLEALPVQLGRLPARVVHSSSPNVVAWGNPAVVLTCGSAKPKDVFPGSAYDFINGGVETGPFYDVTTEHGANVWTTVDRGPYISVAVPAKYQGADVLPPISRAIATSLPAVCSTDSNEPDPDKLCTRRK